MCSTSVNAAVPPKPARVRRELSERSRDRPEEHLVERAWTLPDESIEVVRLRVDFALGDTVSFEGRNLIQRLGSIVRINQKTATVSCDDHEWRFSYGLLRHVVDL